MKISNSIFAALVAAGGAAAPYRHVSEGFAKHLPYQHPFSTKKHPADQADGMMPEGVVICSDNYFFANERNAAVRERNGGVDDFPANGEKIAMGEWPTQSRIRNIRFRATTAALNPGAGATTSFNPTYFPGATVAAFPAFTLQANDPTDPSFVPIPLLDNNVFTDSATNTLNIPTLSLQAMIYGVNRRAKPLIIECVLGGNVVANSGLAVFAEFVKPHT
jgi:hypothetical protein